MLRDLLLLLLLAAGLQVVVTSQEGPLVRTSLGLVRGAWRSSEKGARYASFTAVPFARPPIGELRFKPPEAMGSWSGEWDATSQPPECLTWDHIMSPHDKQRIKGQEDCLYLNVHTPKLPSPGETKLLDVILFIHPGAFMFGNGGMWGAKKLMDRGVVFVTINYRLGPLGFLSLEDDVLPGNNGLRDQTQALRWVQEHIASFGGNPRSVTLMGMSAGGSSVHFHYLSPLSQGLFSRGVSLSGTALCRWALAEGARDKAKQLAASMGCPVDKGSEEILRCLRLRPADRIVAQVEQFQVWQYSPFSPFGPVVERPDQTLPPFLPDTPVRLLRRGETTKAPWVTGVTGSEGLYPSGTFVADEAEMARLDSEFDQLVPHLLDFNRTVAPHKRAWLIGAIRKNYFGNKPICDETAQQVIRMVSDRLFVVDAQRSAEMQALLSPVFFYHFTFRGKHSLSELMTSSDRDYGASHGDDVTYFMDVPYMPDEAREGGEADVERQMLDLWTSFAKDGVPRSAGMSWSPVAPGGHLEYLLVDKAPSEMTSTPDLGQAAFWESLPIHEPAQSLVSIDFKDEL